MRSMKKSNITRREMSPTNTIHNSTFIDDFSKNNFHIQKMKNFQRDLFEKDVSVKMKTEENEEIVSNIHIKLYEYVNSGIRYLYFRLTDEDNLQFMKVLQLNETSFLALKKEQKLLMSFNRFADKFVELIKKCDFLVEEKEISFGCYIHLQMDGSAFFKISEKNEFKELDHLILEFQQPTDEMIKNYLSTCLAKSRANEVELDSDLKEAENEIMKKEKLINEQNEQLMLNKKVLNELESRLREQYEDKINKLKNSFEEAMGEEKRKFEELETRLSLKHTDREKELQEKLEEQRKELNRFTELNDELSQNERELTKKVNLYKDKSERLEINYEQLQNDHFNIKTRLTKAEEENNNLKIELMDLERKLAEKIQIEREQNEKSDLNKNILQKSEDLVAMLTRTNKKLESKVAQSHLEVNKANLIMEDLMRKQEKKQMKATKLKHIINQQETKIIAQTKDSENLKEKIDMLNKQLEENKISRINNEKEIIDLRTKLGELSQKLENKEEDIVYLNKRITEENKSNRYHSFKTNNYSSGLEHRFTSKIAQDLLKSPIGDYNTSKTFKVKSDLKNCDNLLKSRFNEDSNGFEFGIHNRVGEGQKVKKDFDQFDIKDVTRTYHVENNFDSKKRYREEKEGGAEEFPVPRTINPVRMNISKKG